MTLQISLHDPDRLAAIDNFITTSREAVSDVDADVTAIIAEVRAHGDAAVLALTKTFDHHSAASLASETSTEPSESRL